MVPDRSGGEYKLPGRPWHFSRDELTPIGTPAFQGEHNREVFGELGLSEAELQRLSETGALVTHRRGDRTLDKALDRPHSAPAISIVNRRR